MERMLAYTAWQKYYGERYQGDKRILAVRERAKWIEERMIHLARFPGRMYKGFIKRRLENALGVSLGIHRQLLWGLTSASSRGRIKGGGRA
ncbi:hypothetical protein ES705_49378 [subsurface metagenome]